MTTQGIPGNAPGRQRFYEPTPEEQAFDRLCESQLDLADPASIRRMADAAPTPELRQSFIDFAVVIEGRDL
jgi:hypothetical protein